MAKRLTAAAMAAKITALEGEKESLQEKLQEINSAVGAFLSKIDFPKKVTFWWILKNSKAIANLLIGIINAVRDDDGQDNNSGLRELLGR